MTLSEEVRAYFKRTHGRPSKHLGQNFLIDPYTLQEMVWAGEVTGDDLVLEIGAGLGFLTDRLADAAGKVVAVEVDEVLYAELQLKYAKRPHVSLIRADILKLDIEHLFENQPRNQVKAIANLPYYITTPVLWKLLECGEHIGTCVLTVQTEVAQRLVSPPNRKDYGALTVGVAYHAQAEIVKAIPPSAFYPPPQVESTVVRLQMRKHPALNLVDEAWFFRVVRAAFQSRRKMLRNALLSSGVSIPTDGLDNAFQEAGIDPRRRAETLTISEFATLANCLHRQIHKM